jgi:hypothetical protein
VTGYNSSSTPVEYPFHDLMAHISFRATGELKQVKDAIPHSGFRNAGMLTISSKLVLANLFSVFWVLLVRFVPVWIHARIVSTVQAKSPFFEKHLTAGELPNPPLRSMRCDIELSRAHVIVS